MNRYSHKHLADPALLQRLVSKSASERAETADFLSLIAEVDDRKLYLPAGHPSMHSYCVQELNFAPECAYKRIQAARAGRECPAVFEALADGRLNLTAVVLLAPHLSSENGDELIPAAAHQRIDDLKWWLAKRFLPESPLLDQLDSNPVEASRSVDVGAATDGQATLAQLDSNPVGTSQPVAIAAPIVRPADPVLRPVKILMDEDTHKDLKHAQLLLSHQVASGDLGTVVGRALKVLIRELEKRKCAATDRPRAMSRPPKNGSRYIPAAVRQAVWERDHGQCTFVAENGHRCPCRTRIEFDHVLEVARGGEATVDGIRLRCRAHNQYTAERTFGAKFMQHKREESRRRGRGTAPDAVNSVEEDAMTQDVIGAMRTLGYRLDEARLAAAYAASNPNAALEDPVRSALAYLQPRVKTQGPVAPGGTVAGATLMPALEA